MEDYKQRIAFEYPCYICGIVLSGPYRATTHLKNIHGYSIPTRRIGVRRPQDPKYVHVHDPKSRSEFEAYHTSCPSCWYHCPSDKFARASLKDHINKVHRPENVDPSKNKNDDIDYPESGSEEEEKSKKSSNTKSTKKNPVQQTLNDIYQKLDDLAEMFKNLMNNDKQQ